MAGWLAVISCRSCFASPAAPPPLTPPCCTTSVCPCSAPRWWPTPPTCLWRHARPPSTQASRWQVRQLWLWLHLRLCCGCAAGVQGCVGMVEGGVRPPSTWASRIAPCSAWVGDGGGQGGWDEGERGATFIHRRNCFLLPLLNQPKPCPTADRLLQSLHDGPSRSLQPTSSIPS